MKFNRKVIVRALSMALSILMMLTAMPSSAFASIDAPMAAVDGFSDPSVGNITDPPPMVIEGGSEYADDPGGEEADPSGDIEETDFTEGPDEEEDPLEEGKEEIESVDPMETEATLDSSDPVLNLPPDVEADFIAFLDAVGKLIDAPPPRTRAAPGDTGRVSWSWGQELGYTTSAGHYIGNLPSLSLSTADPSLGDPFCAYFGVDPNTSGTYSASEGSSDQILRLLIANHEGRASDAGTQMAIWSITNHNAFREYPAAQSAFSAASSVDTEGYTYLEWDAGSGQPFYTLEIEDNVVTPPTGPTEPLILAQLHKPA